MGIFAFALALIPAAAQTRGPGGSGIALADGVVVDAARGTAFLMNPAGAVEAVELAAGAVLWTSDAASRPLLLAGDLLIAQRRPDAPGSLEIVVLDAGDGGERLATRVALPEGIWGSVRDQPGRSFQARAAVVGNDVTIAWEAAQAAAAQGYLPGNEEGAAPATAEGAQTLAQRASGPVRSAGAVRLDLATGRTAPVLATRAAAVRRPYLDLAAGAGPGSGRYLSADRRHVLASERSGGSGPWQRFTWTLSEAGTGAAVGRVERQAPVAAFVVAGRTLVHEARPTLRRAGDEWDHQPRQLRAVDLTTGVELWSRSLLDTEPQGPFPP